METIRSAEGTKGIMISGDEIGHLIIRGDKKIDLYLKPKGRWTFELVDNAASGDPDATFHIGPPEELFEKPQEDP